ncbi:MAG TPA: ATP-binding cassette domain-containing protein [Spirochaetia bacterium]|nr:ATP-binding cassette domain-containing protein [Spirochaetia bacterium]
MSPDLTIEASGLAFGFKTKPVIDSISFSVEREQFVTFLGPSGCGKTTLLNLIAGIYRPASGRLQVQSERISFVFQNDTLLPWRNALSNVLLPFELRGEPITPQIRERGVRILDQLGLFGAETAAPSELSGGMKKRVELARALVTEPDLLILDEPFSSLDIITREKLNMLLRSIHRDTRGSVVMVTHSVEEACFLSDKIYVLSSLPAQIINVRQLGKNGDTPPDQYLLSIPERDAARDIRKDAKVLWTALQDAPREAGENGGGEELSRQGRAGRLAARVRNHLGGALIPVELVALYFIVVFLKSRLGIADYILPQPAAILSRFFTTLIHGTILVDLAATVYESLAGFLIAFILTLALGYWIAKSRLLSRLLMPYLIAFNTIPTIALAPFLVLWFGFGYTPRIVTSVIVIFFPMLITNISATRLAEKSMSQLISFFRPRRIRRFAYFEFPAALPMIASGVKVSITLSVIGAVVGEFVSGSVGLGSLVNVAKGNFDTELMFVGLLWLVILGLVYYAAATLVTRLVARRLR